MDTLPEGRSDARPLAPRSALQRTSPPDGSPVVGCPGTGQRRTMECNQKCNHRGGTGETGRYLSSRRISELSVGDARGNRVLLLEVLAGAIPWRFKSSHPHHKISLAIASPRRVPEMRDSVPGLACADTQLRPGRTDPDSSPCSTQRRNPSQTYPWNRYTRRLPRAPGAGSSNRRSDRRG